MIGEMFEEGTLVRSAQHGLGRVELDRGRTVIAHFDHGLESCAKEDLVRVASPLEALAHDTWHAPLAAITRAQAECIRSVNDTWGVFSRSRIALLPHQLWVCRRVLEHWPTRWLVADDVGLGKTIEAGLILWPLLARGRVRRLLILCPASLVAQWQYRLRTMFDIRLSAYTTETDTPKMDFWSTHDQVVASLQTLRDDCNGRHERLLESPPWDLLIVDEAHHLNADEREGPTRGYRLVKRLVENQRVASMVFFTGTPHRGKNYGFLSMLQLLDPDTFDPQVPLAAQLPLLHRVMIRNNKQNVTDLRGRRLFKAPHVVSQTYTYSPAEAHFYDMLTEFISTGRAYAQSLGDATSGRAVMLVLIALQKLASSSVAAIRRALEGRLERVVEQAKQLAASREALAQALVARYGDLEHLDDEDAVNRAVEEMLDQVSGQLQLMANEEARLRELVAAAQAVREETKISAIITLLETRFADRSVLLFTEYKATQSLLMSALIHRFSDGCVTFINGDNRAESVIDRSGTPRTMRETREVAAEAFNAGRVRFLVSTEAGGEGIDLQERCYSLVHVDLPWNPMRLHQRVGRLNRYGQTQQVEVVSLHNPDTVESLIWTHLNQKIGRIMDAFRAVMEEPEDLLQLVLGMTSPTLFQNIFASAPMIPRGSLSAWFDQQTAQFGGQDVIQAVQDLVGHCARFDFQEVAADLPRLDLPALRPFLVSMLILHGRRPQEDANGLSFNKPDTWNDPRMGPSYTGLVFNRQDRSPGGNKRILGVGHIVIDVALEQALASNASVTTLPATLLPEPLAIYKVADEITGSGGTVRSIVLGVVGARTPRVLRDWEVLERLNDAADHLGRRKWARDAQPPEDRAAVQNMLKGARAVVQDHLATLSLPFAIPTVDVLSVLWPDDRRDGSDVEASIVDGDAVV